jgi:hypothetical protein
VPKNNLYWPLARVQCWPLVRQYSWVCVCYDVQKVGSQIMRADDRDVIRSRIDRCLWCVMRVCVQDEMASNGRQ